MALVKDAAGATLNTTVTWTSQDTAIATVDNGVVTAVSAGNTSIQAAAGGRMGAAQITVSDGPPAPVDRVEITPASLDVFVGETRQLSAVPFDAQGNALGRAITWSAEPTAVASVSNEGLVTALAEGNATITAQASDKSATAAIVVRTPAQGDINVLPETLQTMIGLEANAAIGEDECDRGAYNIYKDEVVRRAVDEYGLDRLRLEVRAGMENPRAWWSDFENGNATLREWQLSRYESINDNNDPNVAAPGGFNFGEVDRKITDIVNPMRALLEQRGRQLYVALNYVAFGDKRFHSSEPLEYAEFMAEAMKHIRDTYGWVPDGIEVKLEPDLNPAWTEQEIADSLVALKQRMNTEGFTNLEYIGPSTTNMAAAAGYFDRAQEASGGQNSFDELTYHKYRGANDASYRAVMNRVTQFGIRSGMTELIGDDHLGFERDLVDARVSTWTLLGLAYCEPENGGDYFWVDISNVNNPQINITSNVRYMPQYSRTVHRGAVRHEVSPGQGLTPFAFRNPQGDWTVVVRTGGASQFTVGGISSGSYEVFYTTDNQYLVSLPDITTSAEGLLSVNMPAGGVITLHQK